MRKVTYSMGMSLDGYAMGPDGGFAFSEPDDDVFRNAIEQIRDVGVHLMGRRLYETMLYWETAEADDDATREWIALWNPLPKVVFSRTLTSVVGNARLATGGLAEEIARLGAESDDGDIALGGPELAAQAADLGLIDEYHVRAHPVLVGGGTPFFAQSGQRVDLELLATRAFRSGVVYSRYRVRR